MVEKKRLDERSSNYLNGSERACVWSVSVCVRSLASTFQHWPSVCWPECFWTARCVGGKAARLALEWLQIADGSSSGSLGAHSCLSAPLGHRRLPGRALAIASCRRALSLSAMRALSLNWCPLNERSQPGQQVRRQPGRDNDHPYLGLGCRRRPIAASAYLLASILRAARPSASCRAGRVAPSFAQSPRINVATWLDWRARAKTQASRMSSSSYLCVGTLDQLE